MKFVEEVVVEEFLPTVRSMLASALREREFTQHEVAAALGISQSAVSKYAHGDVGHNERVASDRRVRDLVERVADGLATGDMTRVQALVELEVLVRRLEEDDLLSALHEEAMPELEAHDGGFAVHDPESPIRTAEQVRSSLRRGLRAFVDAEGVASLLPNVGSNIVECLPDPEGIEDVAGVPGRIFAVDGRATVPGDPEFGVSGHVASVLLAVRAAGSPARAALNVRYDPDLIDRLAADGLAAVEFDPGDGAAEGVHDRVGDALDGRAVGESAALYHAGAFGVEPITYLIAPDAPAAARLARGLL